MNEFQLIDYIKKLGSAKIRESSQNNLVKGIGDDAAVIKIKKNKFYLITTDALIENVHFSLDTITLYNLGYKSVIVNVSDILSKNGLPLYLLGSINIPPKIKNIHQFIKGINDACKKYNITLIGGDTTSSKNDFCISLTLIGETNKALYRSGYIENGDLICVSNTVGLSGAGFYALNELNKYQKKKFKKAIAHHQKPQLLKQSIYKQITKIAKCGMDNSDGLFFSVCELCEQSQCGCELYFDRIPIHYETKKIAELLNIKIEDIINFGEDYNFVGILPKSSNKIIEANKNIIKIIGIVTNRKNKYLIKDNKKLELLKKGYEHK